MNGKNYFTKKSARFSIRKATAAVFVVALLLVTPLTSSAQAKMASENKPFDIILNDNKNKFSDIYDILEECKEIYQDGTFLNAAETHMYSSLQRLLGNDSNMTLEVGAHVESKGKGLHLFREMKLINIKTCLPFDPLSGLRPLGIYWMYCDYGYDDDAQTIIETKDGETIYINGSHSILVGIYRFGFSRLLWSIMDSIPYKILEKMAREHNLTSLNNTLNKVEPFRKSYHGREFRYTGGLINLSNLSKIFPFLSGEILGIIGWARGFAWLLWWWIFWKALWPTRTKTQIVGFIEQLKFFGLAPIVIVSNKSIFDPILP